MVLAEPGILGEVSPQSRCSDLQGVPVSLVLGPLRGTSHDCYLDFNRKFGEEMWHGCYWYLCRDHGTGARNAKINSRLGSYLSATAREKPVRTEKRKNISSALLSPSNPLPVPPVSRT